MNEDSYSRANDRIREWAARSSQNEPLRSIDVPSLVSPIEEYELDKRSDSGEETDEVELYGRRTG